MTDAARAQDIAAAIQNSYPTLSAADVVVFAHICAEDGLSLKTLSKRLGVGQSIASRHVAALEGAGLVHIHSSLEGSLRRTVRLTNPGLSLRDQG